MAVVTKYGSGYKDPAAIRPIDAVFAEGLDRTFTSKVTVANGDSIASVLLFGKVPSNALISPGSNLYLPAISGLTSFSLGFAAAPAALMSAVNIAAGGTFPAASAVNLSNYVQKAWQLATLTSDPGGMLDIVGTMNTAATAGGDIVLRVTFVKGA
jgi:hypothetical protein